MDKTLTAERIYGCSLARVGFALYPEMSERTHRLCAMLVADGHCERRERTIQSEDGSTWTLVTLHAMPVPAASEAA